MAKYSWDDAKFKPPLPNIDKANVQGIGECFERLAATNGGRLKVAIVENDAAKNGKARHVVGRHLNWNDKEAARHFRCDQVRSLVQVLNMIPDDAPATERPKPAFLNVKDRGGTSYRTLSDVLDSGKLRLAVVQAAERELASFEQRYHMLSDICGPHVRAARSAVSAARAQLENRPS